MALAKVPGTKIRGGVYFLNITIPPPIRHHYAGRDRLTGTLKTADPRVARDGVTVARAEMIRQMEEVGRATDINARLAELPADQRELYERAGGLEGLLEAFQRTRTAQALMLAGDPEAGVTAGNGTGEIHRRDGTVTVIEFDNPPADPLEMEVRAAEHRAASAALEGIARREAKTLRALGQKVEVPGGDLPGILELAEAFIRAKGYTVQLADSLRYTVRRWIEFHTDLPLAKLTRAHLAEFDDAARDLPVARAFLKKPMRAAVAAARKGNLDRVSYKVRERLITHLKALTAYALDKGALAVDPWAGYKFDRPKVKVSERKAAKVEGFTPEQVKAILARVAGSADADTADHWLPMLSAYSGARREELGQLRVSDVLTVGNIPERPRLTAAIDYLRDGDTLVVTKLDRLARSVLHLGEIVKDIRAKGANLRILAIDMDTSTPTGTLLLNMLGSVAQFEREMMLERQREGIAKAKGEGKYKGRKPTALAQEGEVKALHSTGTSPTEIAKKLGIGRTSVYRILGNVAR